MIRKTTALLLGLPALAACGPMSANTQAPPAPAEPQERPIAKCDASAVQQFVGQNATQDSGAAILAQSGAKTLRWGPPGSIFTMDYREDRVNVHYDTAMVISKVTCG